MAVWGLLYTHHKVQDGLLAAMLSSVRGMGLPDDRLVVSCHRPDARLPSNQIHRVPEDGHWIGAIYEQMIAGLSVLPPTDYVLTLEHDVLYPPSYLADMTAAMTKPDVVYYYTNVRHMDIREGERTDFWASDSNGTRTLQSGCGGRVSYLLALAQEDLRNYRAGNLGKDFELGLTGAWATVNSDTPMIDIRHGQNTSTVGYDKEIYYPSGALPQWGSREDVFSLIAGR